MLLQILAGLACALGAVLQLAVYRSPDIRDSVVTETARKITVAALTVSAIYLVYTIFEGPTPSTVFILILGLFGLGQTLFAVNNLLKHLEKGHPRWNSHLSSLK